MNPERTTCIRLRATDRLGGLIPSPGDHRGTFGKSGRFGGGLRYLCRGFGGFRDLGQPAKGPFQGIEHLLRPFAGPDVEKGSAGCIRDVREEFGSQPPADEILGKNNLVDGREKFRFVLLQPEDLGGGESGQDGVARNP